MKILIAEDNPISRHLLEAAVSSWGYQPILAADGCEALSVMQGSDPPPIAVLDWMMPGLDGLEVTKTLREQPTAGPVPTYILMLTAKSEKEDIVAAFDAGADDYLTKPFHNGELRARLMVGERIVGLQQKLAERIWKLEASLGEVTALQSMLPVCSHCHQVREDEKYWQEVEEYTRLHSIALFQQPICAECLNRIEARSAQLQFLDDNSPLSCQ